MARMQILCDEDPAFWSTSEEEEDSDTDLAPPGYENGILTHYFKRCNDPEREKVDCSGCRTVYVDVNTHELKNMDDQKETFQVVFMLKMWWFEPGLQISKSDLNATKDFGNLSPMSGKTEGKMDSEVPKLGKKYPGKPNTEFFPEYSFTNVEGEPSTMLERYSFEWSDENGTFILYETKLDATFSESLELHYFPMDRQLCRMKITAEKTIEDFQFVLLPKKGSSGKCCESFTIDKSIQDLCPSYIRYNDYEMPFYTQRSMITVLYHVERIGDYYFNNILLMVFFVNLMGLCTFAIPVDDMSGRLGLVSSCFLAVLAYRYVINEMLPRKAYMTAADWYITFACAFLVVICVETVFVGIWRSQIDKEGQFAMLEEEDPTLARRLLTKQDRVDRWDCVAGIALSIAWVAANLFLWCLWNMNHRQSWQKVYQQNQEPYKPVHECKVCGQRWLAKQCQHTNRQTCDCGATGDKVRTIYFPPAKDEGPMVKPQPLLQRPKTGQKK